MPSSIEEETLTEIKIEDMIPLDCCDNHFLHPTKFAVYSQAGNHNKWMKKQLVHNTYSPYFEMRCSSSISYLNQDGARKLQHKHSLKQLQRPTVEVIS